MTTKTIENTTELQDVKGREAEVSLGTGFSFGTSDVKAKFTGSRGWKNEETTLEDGKTGIVTSTA